jgi:Cof subfamily protein (haloacid dehalogenase superfamily)
VLAATARPHCMFKGHGMQKIQLIAIDLDGTLLNAEKTISAFNLDALRRAAAQGVLIVVASGRSYRDAMDFSASILEGQPLICANGAMACLHNPYECVYCECLSKAKLRAVTEVLEREKCYYHVYCDDGSVMESRTGNPGRARKLNCYDYQGEVLSEDEMPKYVGDGALKVVCFCPEPDKLKRIRAAMEQAGNLEVNSSWWDNLEVLEEGVNKGAALRALAERLGIPIEQVMAIGDNENDLSMFEAAGLSVAMGNASAEVQAKADAVTETNEEDGVGHAVLKWVLGEES